MIKCTAVINCSFSRSSRDHFTWNQILRALTKCCSRCCRSASRCWSSRRCCRNRSVSFCKSSSSRRRKWFLASMSSMRVFTLSMMSEKTGPQLDSAASAPPAPPLLACCGHPGPAEGSAGAHEAEVSKLEASPRCADVCK